MSWIRYRHWWSTHKGDYEWKYVGEIPDFDAELFIEKHKETLEEELDWTDNYHGVVDVTIHELPPLWVVEEKLGELSSQFVWIEEQLRLMEDARSSAKPCPNCNDRKKIDPIVRAVLHPCKECGRPRMFIRND